MKQEPLILAVETALANGSLSVSKGERVIDSLTGTKKTLRSEDLLQEINKLLKKNDLLLKDLDLIAVSTGPGSFTGIRIGMATAQALSLALNCEITGVSLLEALAFSIQEKAEIVSVVSAGRNQLFWQEFESKKVGEGNIQEFIKELGSQKNGPTVVVASNELEEIFENNLQNLKEQIRIKYASDNVANIIRHFSLFSLKNQHEFKEQILPEYIKDVEIGKH